MSRNQVTIMISGGDIDENRQLSTLVHACLQEKGFTNVSINPSDMVRTTGSNGMSIFDLIRSMNPEIYDTPISVVGETDEDIQAAESAAMESMYSNMRPHYSHEPPIHPGMYQYN